MIPADFVLRRAGVLVTMTAREDDPLGLIEGGALAARAGRVVWVGEDRRLEREVALEGDLLDAAGACVIPGLVDAHTHPVFSGSRADEFAQRLAGAAYATQQSGERGIRRTVRATREADPEDLLGLVAERADRFLAHGTTTIEAKSGYGLNLESERTSLEVLRRLSSIRPLRVLPTFLGAHVVPDGIDRAAFIRTVVEEMLPALRGLATFFDAWCDPPAFTADETRLLLKQAQRHGYRLRVHAAQLTEGEGPTIAAELGASSADHLEFATPTQVQALARAGVVAVLCPGANFTVPGSRRPPIEAMREAGLPMAVASDLNPGTFNSESLAMAMTLACVQWGLTPAEALQGATVHAARSLGLQGVAGCLRVGALADCAVVAVERPQEIPYYVGINRVERTVVGGAVWQSS